ncbi:unnamed protein product [Rhizophagus irregularis]|uniref:Uncharacterized protein n=1 Tax=Rhizophagus irregularis TaxID=588596 RepID=A0A2N1MUA7_9GLOM|nr:hypothetical protein RhiirC2_868910 [Rhizophagus irregularis]CAB4397335.1 unnamed protein product [Rhizophagus irregularis]CAB5384534.1 unnamed protein product [Rhizophagus irregularis]
MPRNKSPKSIRKKSAPYKRSRFPNAWILFSKKIYSLNCETRKIKRTEAMKSARIAWENMSSLQKNKYFINVWNHQNQLKEIKQTLTHLEELTYDNPFIIEEVNQLKVNKVNKEKDDDVFINPEMLEKEMEEDFSLKAFSEKFENLSIMH